MKNVDRIKRIYFGPDRLKALQARMDAVERRFDDVARQLDAERAARVDMERTLRGAMIEQRAHLTDLLARPRNDNCAPPVRGDAIDFDAALPRLRERAPAAYELWRPMLDAGAEAYNGFPTHSCSVQGHPMADLFAGFMRPYLNGPVLDIGCGPQPMPSYLAGHPASQVAGVDPLQPPEPHPFVFHRGVAEFLPWDDGVFSVVVAGTSLDHVLLLDRALEEIHRVLDPDQGRFIAWVAFIEGAEAYNPYRDDVTALDAFHLFHFDRAWFEAYVGRTFEIEETFSFGEAEMSAFYVLRPR